MVERFDSRNVEYWLSGGWAVDFHVGRITREHSDVDFVVSLEDQSTIHELAEEGGFVMVPTDPHRGVEAYEVKEVRLELAYVTEDEQGQLVTPGYQFWPWREGTFNDDTTVFAGIEVQVMSVFGLLDMKKGWKRHIGEAPRPHDIVDIQVLEELQSP